MRGAVMSPASAAHVPGVGSLWWGVLGDQVYTAQVKAVERLDVAEGAGPVHGAFFITYSCSGDLCGASSLLSSFRSIHQPLLMPVTVYRRGRQLSPIGAR